MEQSIVSDQQNIYSELKYLWNARFYFLPTNSAFSEHTFTFLTLKLLITKAKSLTIYFFKQLYKKYSPSFFFF